MLRTSDVSALAALVRTARLKLDRPALVGISGFGGAGKSTLAGALREHLPKAVVVPGDEFLLDRPTTKRCDDWSSVDRMRLLDQVLLPVRRGAAPRYQIYDGGTGSLGPWIDAAGSVVVVEGLGLFHPELAAQFDLRIWIDVDLDSATAQGKWRDEHVWQNPQTELWNDVWMPNDADFFARFRPDLAADIHYAPAS